MSLLSRHDMCYNLGFLDHTPVDANISSYGVYCNCDNALIKARNPLRSRNLPGGCITKLSSCPLDAVLGGRPTQLT